jgi:hypothetical protein
MAMAGLKTNMPTPTTVSSGSLMMSTPRSIYDGTRMSGEYIRHHALPIYEEAEVKGLTNDAENDAVYAQSLAKFFTNAVSAKGA